MTYTAEQLRSLFQHKFNLNDWTQFLVNYIGAQTIRQVPEQLDLDPSEGKGFYLGQKKTTDNYEIGLFYVQTNTSVAKRRVGLRQIVKPYLRYLVDAALVVFDDGRNWRLSFVCDIKEESIAPKRFTFVFGERDNYYNTAVSRFVNLQKDGVSFLSIKDAFSVEALTKQFYQELFEWYQWAVSENSNITFPNNPATEDDDREDIDIKIIRMITRLMFVWFIKQKDLVPNKIFDTKYLSVILKDFDPQSKTVGNYYNAILQNLFFATLNREIVDEKGTKRRFATAAKRDVKTLYRYEELFKISEEEVIDLFAEVPFLNGGLFECLDKTRYIDGVEVAYNYDGFSRNDRTFPDGRFKHRAVVPNVIFFDPEKGLIPILSRYNFTIEENSPEEQQVALDPELLGKVFENLLGAYNPETKETARNQSGSFYTPREIVNYMVDESLITYLGDTSLVRSLFKPDFSYNQTKADEYSKLIEKLKDIKILDPACGSGAFPMGLLNRMVEIMHKLEVHESTYSLKLAIIENCIYGSDIQSIAAQITKLRFFISLICDCEKDASKPNFGIPTLPNLETKFVSADSLIAKKKQAVMRNLFENPEIEPTKQALADVRHRHFSAKSASTKHALRVKDKELREKLAALLSDDNNFAPEDAKQLAAWNPYDQNAVSPFFDPEWMFGITDGFDIVIGNPPYIQLQNNGGELAKKYEGCEYKTFARTGDIYCLFYERGWQLLKKGGHLCFITSNKWMRAGYGEKTREFFATKTNPQLLIDFAGVKIFESATVDTNILLFSKTENQHETVCAVTNKQNKDSVKNLSDFVQQQNSICNFATSDSWVVLSPIEQSIKKKIEAVGTPLKDWDINIYRGVLTGCNEAFIIDTQKRDEILANCQTEDRPILRGRDIKRYGYDWANLWLIATFPSRHYDIDKYPSIKQYLLSFGIERLEQTGKTHIINGDKVKARKKTNNKWFETQDSISYWEDFSRPKIIWKRIGSILRFSFDNKGCLGLDSTCFAAGEHIEYLCCVLNSLMGHYLLKDSPKTGTGDLLVSVQAIEPARIPYYAQYDRQLSPLLGLQIANPSNDTEKEINDIVFTMYGLSPNEREYVTQYVKLSQQSL